MTAPLNDLQRMFIQGKNGQLLSVNAMYSLYRAQMELELVGLEFFATREEKRQGRKIHYEVNTPEAIIFAGNFLGMTGIIRARAIKDLVEKYDFPHFYAFKPYDIEFNLRLTEQELQGYFIESTQKFGYRLEVCQADSFQSEKHPDYTMYENIGGIMN